MHLNTTPPTPARKPCMRDMAELIRPEGLLPEKLIPLLPMKQLRRRADEISATHPQYREELPVLLSSEAKRRGRFTKGLRVTVNHIKAA